MLQVNVSRNECMIFTSMIGKRFPHTLCIIPNHTCIHQVQGLTAKFSAVYLLVLNLAKIELFKG